jgi:hypothetical protein
MATTRELKGGDVKVTRDGASITRQTPPRAGVSSLVLPPSSGIDTKTDTSAEFTIEVALLRNSTQGNVLGTFSVWKKKGGDLYGSGEAVKFCPINGCIGTIDPGFCLTEEEMAELGDNLHVPENWPPAYVDKYMSWLTEGNPCPVCHRLATKTRLQSNYGFVMPISMVAVRLADIFRSLGSNADVHLITPKKHGGLMDARKELKSGDFKASRYEKKLAAARDREHAMYRLSKIIADVSTGSTLESRFESFLRA